MADEINGKFALIIAYLDRYGINCKLVWTVAGYFLQIDASQAVLSPDFINVTQMASK